MHFLMICNNLQYKHYFISRFPLLSTPFYFLYLNFKCIFIFQRYYMYLQRMSTGTDYVSSISYHIHVRTLFHFMFLVPIHSYLSFLCFISIFIHFQTNKSPTRPYMSTPTNVSPHNFLRRLTIPVSDISTMPSLERMYSGCPLVRSCDLLHLS